MQTIRHKYGALLRISTESISGRDIIVRVINLKPFLNTLGQNVPYNHIHNVDSQLFEPIPSGLNFANPNYNFVMFEYVSGVYSAEISTLDGNTSEVILEIYHRTSPTTATLLSRELHAFGDEKSSSVYNVQKCTIYGTLLDVFGKPMSGKEVKVYLNKNGYFVHKAGVIGNVGAEITDSEGYFELPMVHDLDITITIPEVGFTTRGFVPRLNSVELKSTTLLSALPKT